MAAKKYFDKINDGTGNTFSPTAEQNMLAKHGWQCMSRKKNGCVWIVKWGDRKTGEIMSQGSAVALQRERNKQKVAPVIEVYFDPNGMMNGKQGAYRSRLRDFHGLNDAGESPEIAVRRLVQNIVCHVDHKEKGKYPVAHLPHTPETLEGYTMVRLDPWHHNPLVMDWKARNPEQEADDVQSQQSASSLVSHMLGQRLRGW